MDAVTIDYAVARSAGRAALRPGPELSRTEASEVVDGLRSAARASVAHVAEVTGLTSPPSQDDMLVVDRATWLDANLEMVESLLAAAGASGAEGLRGRLAGLGNGVQVGGALGLLSGRILGQFVPFGRQRLLLVAPNIAAMERRLGVDGADFRLWVCLHEQTHRLQFVQAPWLGEYLVRQLARLLDEPEDSSATPSRPSSAIEALLTPAQRIVFDQMTAVMSLLEGYADVMMDRVGTDVVPTVALIRERFNAHRQRRGLVKVVNKLMGLDLKLAQYRDGAVFCRAVIERVGVAGLNAVYESSGMLPTLDEIHVPEVWLARAFPTVGVGAGDVSQPEGKSSP